MNDRGMHHGVPDVGHDGHLVIPWRFGHVHGSVDWDESQRAGLESPLRHDVEPTKAQVTGLGFGRSRTGIARGADRSPAPRATRRRTARTPRSSRASSARGPALTAAGSVHPRPTVSSLARARWSALSTERRSCRGARQPRWPAGAGPPAGSTPPVASGEAAGRSPGMRDGTPPAQRPARPVRRPGACSRAGPWTESTWVRSHGRAPPGLER
jgi:hypothetical protein